MRYRFYQTGNKVIAVSSFAKKPVKGVAKCNPNDEFDLESGKKLAAARCNQKIAKKRLARATKEYGKAAKAADEACAWFDRMREYYMDSVDALDEANAEVVKIAEEL